MRMRIDSLWANLRANKLGGSGIYGAPHVLASKQLRIGVLGLLLGSLLIMAIGIPRLNLGRSNGSPLPGGAYVYPIMSARLSSGFGDRNHPIYKVKRHHKGVDLAAPEASPIRTIAKGTVVFADPYAGYGNLVVIDHGNGLTSHYGHCNTMDVQPGQKIEAGHIIATVGMTGNVTGPHLHLEIRKNGEVKDPLGFLPFLSEKAQG
jgi:murein DD-endopeptidase MepM/ murein hydrolase activator NlpD